VKLGINLVIQQAASQLSSDFLPLIIQYGGLAALLCGSDIN